MGWNWDQHRLSTIQDYHPSAGTPHGIEEVNPVLTDTLTNKLVSNGLIKSILDGITENTTNISDIKSKVFTIVTSNWVVDSGGLSVEVHHNFDMEWLSVTCWNTDTKKIEKPSDVVMIDENIIKIFIGQSPLNLSIRVSN